MGIISVLLNILGGLCLFLYGMKVMSDGIQQGAGDRLRRALNFMTINRFAGVLTGFVVTGIVQSSSAVTVMVVSFVNAGLLTLTQSIGVIMGANIGTTVTAWIVSLVGFSLQLSAVALPAVGIGFVCRIVKWKYRTMGEMILGFGLLFFGLDFLTKSMPAIGDSFNFIASISDRGFLSIFIGMCAGLVMTLLIHSSSASTAITLTMAYNGMIGYEMAAAMVLGANIGTTIDAALAAIGTKTAARQAALVHVLFNVIGTCWALPLIGPLLALVNIITPGTMTGMSNDPAIPTHLAMLHTVFNSINTILFLPFVKQFAALVSFIIKDKKDEEPQSVHYSFEYRSGTLRNTPELNILRAEKEIRDMAGLASDMFGKFSVALNSMQENPLTEDAVAALIREMRAKEEYADEMLEALTAFLIECTRERLNRRSEQRVTRLFRIIAELEDMTDDCYSMSFILEQSVQKNRPFKNKEMTALIPYVGLVAEFLNFIGGLQLGAVLSREQSAWARELEDKIDKSRDKLRKLGRKRIEAGKDVKTELLFIDMVRRIEKLGDYCYSIAAALTG
ncbi:MAG: Na/Pi cotransporter family protein [Treponema sp.]|jgi:phosphate:Na+ symporter|nr:Na/Pi cotransporter family protein [Treponema sp.]